MDIDAIQGKHGVNWEEGSQNQFLPVRCYALSLALSGGHGWPRRKIYEAFGPESSGKTTLFLETCGLAAQNPNNLVLIGDQETPMDDDRLAKFGLFRGVNCIVFHGKHVEDVFDIIEGICDDALCKNKKGNPTENKSIVVMIDSINSTPPAAHFEIDSYGQSLKVGAHSNAWGNSLRVWRSRVYFDDITLMLTNHRTDKINTGGFGKKHNAPGGNAKNHWATSRLEMVRISWIKNAEGRNIGQVTKITTVKNKNAPPMQDITLPLFFGNPLLPADQDFVGTWDDLACLFFLKDLGIIKTKGAWSSLLLFTDEACTTTEEVRWSGDSMWIEKVVATRKEAVYRTMRHASYNPLAYGALKH